ncbi:hypothetical protein [Romboutsia ilealis]|nr:hypothetical protein [Romboutsia ilealis]
MRRFIYFVVLMISITPVLTHILEKNYIFIFILHPFIKKFMAKSNYYG